MIPLAISKRHPHRLSIFTQGLYWDGHVLFESGGLRGKSTIAQLDLNQSTVVSEAPLPKEYFAEDLTQVNDQLIMLTYQSRLGLHLDKKTLAITKTFPLQGEGWGVTFDGHYLIISDGTDTLSFHDPITYRLVKKLRVKAHQSPVMRLNALQYIEGMILANVWQSDYIAVISPSSGQIQAWLDCRELVKEVRLKTPNAGVLNGIAWQPASQHMLITGKHWPILFEVPLHIRDNRITEFRATQ